MSTRRRHAVGHHHAVSRNVDRSLLVVALSVLILFLLAEVSAGLAFHSLALVADAGHMVTDAAAIGLSIWATTLSMRPASNTWTFGLKRTEILSAAVNGLTLLVTSILVLVAATRRLVDPVHTNGTALVVVASSGVVVNVVVALVLSRANRSSLNIQGALKHTLNDLWAFLGTVIAGVVILTTGFSRADALASIFVAVLMARTAWGLLRDSGRILLEASPIGVDLDEVRRHLSEEEYVVDVHDLHAWLVTSDLPALSAHITVEAACFNDGRAPMLLDRLQRCLVGHFDLEHSTFQLEPKEHLSHEGGTH